MILSCPARVESRIVRMRAEPFTGCSVTVRSEFFTAKPTPCSCFSSIPFPCQKNVYRCSFSDQFSASRVSCKVAMSMFSLSSSESIMAVFLESLICRRSFDKPGRMVLIFQLAMRRAGIFFALFCLTGGSQNPPPLSASLVISKGMQAIHLTLALLQELLLRCKR